MEQIGSASFFEKARALLVLKDALGSAFHEQKHILLDKIGDVSDLPTAELLVTLKQMNFIDSSEVLQLTQRFIMGGAPAAPAVPAVLDMDVACAFAFIVHEPDVVARINEMRSQFDSAYPRWMPHINFLFPFVGPENFPRIRPRIEAVLKSQGEPFWIRFDRIGFFSQGKAGNTFHLKPDASSTQRLERIYNALKAALPECPVKDKPFHPHLTLAQCTKEETAGMQRRLDEWLGRGIQVWCGELTLLTRSREDKSVPFSIAERLPIGGELKLSSAVPACTLAGQLKSLFNVDTVESLLKLALRNRSWGVLEEEGISQDEFDSYFASVLEKSEEAKSYWRNVMSVKQAPKKEVTTSKGFQMFCNGGGVLCLPSVVGGNGGIPFFVALDSSSLSSLSNVANDNDDQSLLILLDVSSSMNHDERGMYQPPESPDHAASSIKRARQVCVELAFLAFQRGTSVVTIVPWHSFVTRPIQLKASEFFQQEDVFLEDSRFRAALAERVNERAFLAGGATNFEGVLDFCTSYTQDQRSVQVWLITDGEPTCLSSKDENGEPEYIPTSKKHPKYEFFNVRDKEDDLTNYEKGLCTKLKKSARGHVVFHFCVFGEAPPKLISGLAGACEGVVHPVRKDLATLIDEFKGSWKGSSSKLVLDCGSGKMDLTCNMVDGNMYARGFMELAFWSALRKDDGKKRFLILEGSSMEELRVDHDIDLPEDMCQDIGALLNLERQLADVMDEVRQQPVEEVLARASQTMHGMRRKRAELVGRLSRRIRYPMLKTFLEHYMDALLAAEHAFERMLSQYFLKGEGKDLKKVADKVDMLTERDRQALAAGVQSVRVGMGGFVAKRYDRQVAKIIASKGALGRKMLNRLVVLGRTQVKEETWLSLYVLDASADVKMKLREPIQHNVESGKLMCGQVPFEQVFPNKVDSVPLLKVRTSDLQEFEKHLVDPLSFSSLLELIQEQQSLPACLYNISAHQGAGILFDAKELLRIERSDRDGADFTSFSYFRMLTRLNGNEEGGVEVPGAFGKFNFALPLAMDPLSSCVLSTTLVGLFTEPVTGSSIAPLPESGLFYAAFLVHHMRSPNMTMLDVTRALQCLASLGAWVLNPRTHPPLQEVQEATARIFGAGEISKQDSPGFVPIRAIAYGLLDETLTPRVKQQRLLEQCALRFLRGGTFHDDQKAQFFQSLAEDLSGQKLSEVTKEVPTKFLDVTCQLAEAAKSEKAMADLLIVHQSVFAARLKTLFCSFPHWKEMLRCMQVFAAIAEEVPFSKLLDRCKAFQIIDDLVEAVYRRVSSEVQKMDDETIWIRSNGDCISVHHGQSMEVVKCCQLMLGLWSFQGGRSNGFGMSQIDWDVAACLMNPQDTEAMAKLNATQLSLVSKAREYRDGQKMYFGFLPPPVVIEPLKGELVRAESKTAKNAVSDVPRSTMAIIGDVDHGKSSMVGHLIYEAGDVEPHVMRAIEKQARDNGKESMKYAWLMDRLREERERGVTIMWKAWSLASKDGRQQVDIIDCPGHLSFVKNMATGSSLADAVVCVISAAKGEFEYGFLTAKNTLNEIMISAAQGIKFFIFAVNKMDLPEKPQERFQEIVDEVSRIVKRKFNLTQFCFIPISAWTGMNLMEHNHEACPWWDGVNVVNFAKEERTCRSLFEVMSHVGSPPRDDAAPFRMPISACYKIRGVGTVVSGRVISGSLAVGDEVSLIPLGGKDSVMKVKSIEIFRSSRTRARAGDLVGVAIPIPYEQVHRGFCLVKKGDPISGTTCFTAQLKLVPGSNVTVKVGFNPFVYVTTASFSAKVVKLISKMDARTGQVLEENPAQGQPGDIVMVQMETENPVALDGFAQCPPMGRLILQANGTIMALGIVKAINVKVNQPAAIMHKAKGNHFK